MSLQPGIRHDPHATVQVGRLQQRFVCADATQAVQLSAQWPELSAAWHGSLQGVDDALQAAVPSDPEEWVLIPRVQVHARWRPEAPTSQWGQDWWQAVGRAVDDCVQSPQAHAVLRYRRRSLALADLLYRSALGDTSRQWAWQCMGLIDRADLAPEEALRQGWSQLCGRPTDLGPVLQSLLRAERDTGAWSAVLRRLRAADWHPLRAALPGAWAGAAQSTNVRGPHDQEASVDPSAPMLAHGAHAPLMAVWRAWVQRQPVLVARWAARAEAGDTLTALLGAWCWPWASASEVQAHWPRWRAQVFQGAASDAAPSGRHALRRAVPEVSAAAPSHQPAVRSLPAWPNQAEDHPLVHDDAEREDAAARREPPRREADDLTVPELPQQTDTRQSLATDWAGACFWLGRVPQVWPALGAALADALGVPPHDPVSRLWRGGFGVLNEADHAAVDALEALSDEVAETVRHTARQQVQDWAERLWADLGADDLATPTAAMEWLVKRPATLRIEPGWVEVCFEPAQVDTRIRRLALDLDPGWVPWCQAVVRFRYD